MSVFKLKQLIYDCAYLLVIVVGIKLVLQN